MKYVTSVFIMLLGCSTAQPPQKESPPNMTPPAIGSATNWSTVEAVQENCAGALREATALRDALQEAPTGERSVQNTLLPYNELLTHIENALGWSSLMFQVHPDEAIRTAAGACKQDLMKFHTDVQLNRGIYDAIQAVELEDTDGSTKRFTERALREFRRSGVDKDEATRERVSAIQARIVELSQTFQTNVREDVRSITIADAAALKGLPEDWIASHSSDDGSPIEVTTNSPDFLPFQTYCEREDLRQKLYTEYMQRGYPANKAILTELLTLRHEFSNLLNFSSWAAYNAADKMVKTSERVAAFIEELATIVRPHSARDLEALLAAKRQDSPDAARIEVWDRFYYQSRVRAQSHGFDAREARPYFPYPQVKAGLMDLYSELFGLGFRALPDEPTWHESVGAYALLKDGQEIARFYLDMHPRDGKYKHAAMFGIHTGLTGQQLPMASLVCNFPNPAEGDALMEHRQVQTFFHEFGHLLHHLLARHSSWVNLGGINVEWDFVEAPSQILEEWAWSPEVLSRFARHVETGEVIPTALVERMRNSEEFGKGAHLMRQLFYTAFSYFLHSGDPSDLELDSFTDEIYAKYSPYPRLDGGRVYASFGHLIGYSSMYYTYQWSLVIAKDLFTRFEEAGIMNGTVAREYIDKILVPGGERDANELVEDFLGRPYNLDAYRRWLDR